MQSDGSYSALSPSVQGDITLSINTNTIKIVLDLSARQEIVKCSLCMCKCVHLLCFLIKKIVVQNQMVDLIYLRYGWVLRPQKQKDVWLIIINDYMHFIHIPNL